MPSFRKIALVMVAAIIGIASGVVVEHLSIPGVLSLVSPAEARVGRPLTPVSVAGVARRTVRRCAAGIYNC